MVLASFEPVQYNGTSGAEPAVIVDLDNTLFQMNPNRTPYQYWRVEEDTLSQPVATMVRMVRAYGFKAVLSTGRPDNYRPHTERALTKRAVIYDALIMRKTGDRRPGFIVKHENFHQLIAPNWDVKWALEDRIRETEMYRLIGVPCWQVASNE